MKCVSCGGEVASNQERCPYCNTVNKVAVEKNKQIGRKKFFNKKLKEQVLETSKEYIWNNILNRTMITMAIIFCVLFVINFTTYLIAEGELQSLHKPQDIEQQLRDYYENHEYNKLSHLMGQYDLMGEKYYKYSQISLFYSKYEEFISNRNECMNQIENQEILKDHDLEYTLKYGFEILVPNIYNYKEIEAENQEILEEYQQSVIAFFQTYLKLDKKEIEEMCNLGITKSSFTLEFEEMMEKIRERQGHV